MSYALDLSGEMQQVQDSAMPTFFLISTKTTQLWYKDIWIVYF